MMRSPASERSLIIHSDDDDDARSGHDVEEPEQDSDSDSSSSSSSCATPRRGPSSPPYIQQWPQSYRQSIDILSSVQSPNLSFLGTPTLSRLSNSFLAITDSFRSKAPETISSFIKPLLGPTPSDDQQRQHEGTRKSSEYLVPSRRSSLQQIPEDQKPPVGGHGASHDQNCSYTQGVMNGVSLKWLIHVNLFRDLTAESSRGIPLVNARSTEPRRVSYRPVSRFSVPILHLDICVHCGISF